MAAKIKKGDKVIVTTGRDKGLTGEVTKVNPDKNTIIVQGVNVRKRHQRPTQADPGGIKPIETLIQMSNVAHIDPRDKKAVRVGFKFDTQGRKIRYSKRSGEAIDV